MKSPTLEMLLKVNPHNNSKKNNEKREINPKK